jgi:hypothetical protein
MERFELDTEAGQISAELARRGVSATSRVRIVVEVLGTADLPMAAMAQAGGAFDWLADEPYLYSDADLRRPCGPQSPPTHHFSGPNAL